jgi:hypothetical protein
MARKADYSKFLEWAPRMVADVMKAIPEWGKLDAAACVGNGGHESGGFRLMQELRPVVPGSRGGLGGFQWTGPRRRKFEAWCGKKGLNPHSYEATLGFLLVELRGSEKATVAKVAKAATLDEKTVAFEKAFERAGVKHYPARKKYALMALQAYEKRMGDAPEPTGHITDEHRVRVVQQWLRNLGYVEVGVADGKLGTFTKGAIRDYRADKGLPLGDYIDEQLIDTLATDKEPRKLDPKRAGASPGEVKERIPEAAEAGKAKELSALGKIGAQFTAILAAVFAFFDAIVSKIPYASGWLAPIKDLLGDVPGYVWIGGVLAVAVAVYVLNRETEKAADNALDASVDAFREGARR